MGGTLRSYGASAAVAAVTAAAAAEFVAAFAALFVCKDFGQRSSQTVTSASSAKSFCMPCNQAPKCCSAAFGITYCERLHGHARDNCTVVPPSLRWHVHSREWSPKGGDL